MNTKDIRERLELIIDDVSGKTLKEQKSIKHIGIDEEKNLIILIIAITKLGGDEEKVIRRKIAQIVKMELGFNGVKIQMEELRKIESIVNRNIKFFIISSGKGGVGKSTVAANLAYALTRMNMKVGLIDADIYGSSLPKILEMEHRHPKGTEDGKIIPFKQFGIEMMSTEFFTEIGKPVIWRGAMLHQMINNFFYEVKWSKDLEIMIIDAPPGTGDVALDLKNIIPTAEVIIVTTPHLAASHVAIKAGFAAKQMKHNLLGVIENMSYYLNPASQEKDYIFGRGGGVEVATKLDTELLAQIPINQPKRNLALYESDEEIGKIYDTLATLLAVRT